MTAAAVMMTTATPGTPVPAMAMVTTGLATEAMEYEMMAESDSESAIAPTTTSMPVTTTTSAFTVPDNYQQITNVQKVNGKWSATDIHAYFDPSIFEASDLANDDYATAIALVLLEEHFENTKFEWQQSADNALNALSDDDDIQSALNDVIGRFGFSISSNDIMF